MHRLELVHGRHATIHGTTKAGHGGRLKWINHWIHHWHATTHHRINWSCIRLVNYVLNERIWTAQHQQVVTSRTATTVGATRGAIGGASQVEAEQVILI